MANEQQEERTKSAATIGVRRFVRDPVAGGHNADAGQHGHAALARGRWQQGTFTELAGEQQQA